MEHGDVAIDHVARAVRLQEQGEWEGIARGLERLERRDALLRALLGLRADPRKLQRVHSALAIDGGARHEVRGQRWREADRAKREGEIGHANRSDGVRVEEGKAAPQRRLARL